MINYDKDNIFSKILANEIPAIRVFEDSSNLVIMDAYPEKQGHMLAKLFFIRIFISFHILQKIRLCLTV